MTCKQTRQLLAAYRREDLSPGENAELQAHLLECADCRARAAEFRQIGEALQALPKLAPPPDFYARVMAAVRAEEQQAAEKKQEQVIIPGMTDVSYLPTVRRAVTERRARVTPLRSQMSPAGVFALRYGASLAALFLIFAIGVSAGLFFLRSTPPGSPPGVDCLLTHTCSGLNTFVYNPDPAYPLVASATASPDGQYVIYAAHNASGGW
ncbi:MAG TPA: zf-HC2 domain-containing protein, partial [Ktedonobacterales bacterium]|nr:zf-HC2 domain-containing protein [Ktedonobacterales bacterium]